jgi:hypothetical protein
VRLVAHGVSIDAPHGWEARIMRRATSAPFLHVANFALLSEDGDFGAAATGRMHADSAFAALVQYTIDRHVRPGVGLFSAAAWDRHLSAAEFSPSQLQVTRPGQLGSQRFFTEAQRPFCLYCVVAPVRTRPDRLVAELAGVLATLRVGDAA